METPLCNFKGKLFEKVCTKKNYIHISVHGWIRTHGHHKIMTVERDALDLSATILCDRSGMITGTNFTCWQQPKLWKVGTRTHKHLGKKFWLVCVVLHMAYLFQVGEQCGNGFWWGFEVIFKIIYYYISNFRVQNFFFPCAKRIFLGFCLHNSFENLLTRPKLIGF